MGRAKTSQKGSKKAKKRVADNPTSEGVNRLEGTTEEVVGQLVEEGNKAGVLGVVREMELVIKKLQLDLAQAKQKAGRHSEGVTSDQLALLFDELKMARQKAETPDDIAVSEDDKLVGQSTIDDKLKKKAKEAKAPPKGPERRPPPASLPRVDNPLCVPEEQHACPECREPLTAIEPEVTEIIDYEPGRVFVRLDKREVRVCRANACAVVRGPLGDKVVPGGIYGSRLIAHIVVSKYRKGLSLHRVREDLLRMGFDMPSASISDQVLWSTELLEPVWRALLDEVIGSDVMQLDGTSMPVHHKVKGKKQVVRRGTLWLAVGDARAAAFTYSSTAHKRGQRDVDLGPEDLLARRRAGPVVADADNKFDASFRRKALIECGCAMHGRRGFIRSLDAGNKRAAIPIGAFKKIYALERFFIEEEGLRGDELAEQRRARAGPVWEQLLKWCTHIDETVLPASKLAIAARYIINHYDALTRYLDDGSIPIDNGLVERLFRRIATVRKNALFVGSHDGGRRAAVIFSILTTCEIIGLNPEAYLADVLPRLARGIRIAEDLPALMPAAWLADNPDAAIPAMNVQKVSTFNDPVAA